MPFSALKPSDEFPKDLSTLSEPALEVLQRRVNEELFRECNERLVADAETVFRFNAVAHEVAIREAFRDLKGL
ncbi:hypothetical protein [Arthrobacter crystallopoietes]|jgi:hypothetical protein|uniref:hypothetical protein n=1 Tax=Crystallibacter crystallopoietes TaxID=37928 RepID=UPI0011114B1B|nr:hypothetical protein [Arthrobacter crystallopoietes]QTG80783.1 hypothetical protein J5251_18580 [Arthrobacter crystallopoietes]